ncbi:hypothetical protein QUB68_24235 [Microcoleus sp. A006_D1]|uniref:hypothetical protein n=1 Tax=Microcoleus sp. A006_D1 TaxID=3055267 RepID=UPI002FD2F187
MVGSFLGYPCLLDFTSFVGGNARLAADFVADVTDELGVGCGCCGGARLVAGVWGSLLGGFRGLKKPGFYGDLGLFASIWEKNPVSGWVAGVWRNRVFIEI